MKEKDILKLFEDTGALLSGHFRLSSGLHSGNYFQCALLIQHPDIAEKLCTELEDYFKDDKHTCVVAHDDRRTLRIPVRRPDAHAGPITPAPRCREKRLTLP